MFFSVLFETNLSSDFWLVTVAISVGHLCFGRLLAMCCWLLWPHVTMVWRCFQLLCWHEHGCLHWCQGTLDHGRGDPSIYFCQLWLNTVIVAVYHFLHLLTRAHNSLSDAKIASAGLVDGVMRLITTVPLSCDQHGQQSEDNIGNTGRI